MSGFGPLGDPQFWKDMGSNAASPYRSLQEFGQIPARADDVAEQTFPGSARDASTKNAFRHALGTGMVTQALGGGAAGGALAKGAGYLWEGLGLKELIQSGKHRTDTLHDLNANAVGAAAAQQTGTQQGLIQALKRMALESVPQQPPGAFSASPGYLTRTER